MQSLIAVYEALGLPPRVSKDRWPLDVSPAQIAAKVVHPKLAIEMGADKAVPLLRDASFCANHLDAFFETGDPQFLQAADQDWAELLRKLPVEYQPTLIRRAQAASTFFYYEQDVAERIERNDRFLQEEVVEYFLRRGSDAPLYAALLAIDGIEDEGLTAAFRAFQALWDLADDIVDMEHDRESLGANILLMSVYDREWHLRRLANNLIEQGRRLPAPRPLIHAIEEQYERTRTMLN